MSDSPRDSAEDPRARFKRLLSSSDEDKSQEDDASQPELQVQNSGEESQLPEAESNQEFTAGQKEKPVSSFETKPMHHEEDEQADTKASDHSDPEIAIETRPNINPEETPQPYKPDRRISPPALSDDGMPLPRRVDEIDMDATRITPIVPFQSSSKKPSGATYGPVSRTSMVKPINHATTSQLPVKAKKKTPISWQTSLGCLIRMAVLGAFGFVLISLLLGTVVLLEYYSVSATIPSVDDLRERASQFETTRILDRNGNPLYEILDPNAGRRTYISIDKISPYLVAATIATEDQNFYNHPGFDPMAILRAFYQNFRNDGETVSGASTITQQVARNLLFTPEERVERTYLRKVREALAAAEITRRYSKDEILELYLNENFYGNLSYGVEAASEIYFNTTADKLTLGQASFLAGLPQAPSVYDIYNNRDLTLQRLQQVLTLMYETSQQQKCIHVSNNPQPICVDRDTALSSYAEIQNYPFAPAQINIRYPHWVFYIRSQLESMYDSQTIYRSGFSVYTTLDPGLQDDAQRIVSDQVSNLADYRATNGALVAIKPATGEILAMVGSADFNNEAISGEVNMAVSSTRQPGSTIKPVTYLAAFEKGWTPSTLIWDVPTDFSPSGVPNDPSPPYKPVNYDGKFHGPVLLRSALANSYNLPAVKTLEYVGIYDNPNTPGEDGMIAMARKLGITSLTRPDYGLSLTLGGGEVSLLEMTSAYAVIANSGLKKPPVSILKIVDHTGQVVFEYENPVGEQVIRSEHAYLISSILSDNAARTPAFGSNSVLALPFLAAAKTGTTNDYRDNWTIGYTPDIVVGVWVGNSDYTPMQNTSGLTGAAPIWADFIQVAIQKLTGGNPAPFIRPAGIVDRVICSVSGTEPSQWCPSQRGEIFAADQLPLPKEEDLWMKGVFDTWTGLKASQVCGDLNKEEFAVNVTDPWGIKWILESSDGQNWIENLGFKEPYLFVPPRECRADDPRPLLSFVSPIDGQTITNSPIDIFGRADATSDFKRYELSYGLGLDPVEWKLLKAEDRPINQAEKIYTWDLLDTFKDGMPSGPVTLRLQIESNRNTYAELKIKIDFNVPTVTPTQTSTPTSTPTFTPTLFPTSTSTQTPLPSLTPVSTQTIQPSLTATATETPTNTPVP